MVHVLHELEKLRNNVPFEIDPHNSNRYRILVKDSIGKTAYCFSTPIYNTDSRKLVSGGFTAGRNAWDFTGSNAHIIAFKQQIVLRNADGNAIVRFPFSNLTIQDGDLHANGWRITPTVNGVHIRVAEASANVMIQVNKPFYGIRHCSKSFAIMQEEFRPFLLLSPLIAKDAAHRIFPAQVTYSQTNECTYEIAVTASKGTMVEFEINLYEPKLFQDTTVESIHSDENNAFGGIAFIGKTQHLGEQWLYLRPDFSKIAELYSVYVNKVLLHFPLHCTTGKQLSVYAPASRFCSFGSTWNNKIQEIPKSASATVNNNYLTLDLSNILTDPNDRRIIYSEGLILKPHGVEEGFTTLSTGDNYSYPLILEVQYE